MRLTIVTPTLNRAHFLAAAIESVRAQTGEGVEVEHIVVDGMSTDGTPELLARYPHLRVIREPDTGLYDALNKGIRAATGEVIGHLNSDDQYAPGAFATVAAAFAQPGVEVVSGGAEIVETSGRVLHRFLPRAEIALSFANVTLGAPIPNARFFRREIYARAGLYHPQYRVAADREFLLRVAALRPVAAEVEQILYRYHQHEESLTFAAHGEGEARWRDEYLSVAENFLARAGLLPDAVRPTQRWHLRESAQAATQALWRGEWSALRRAATRGLRQNATWPVMFLRHVAGQLLGR